MTGSADKESTINDGKINVRVLFFGAARDVAGQSEVELTLTGPTSAADAFAQLQKRYPELRRFGRSLLFAVNQEYAPRDCQVQEGDELALFPPVSGGSNADAGTKETEDANTGTAGVPPASRMARRMLDLRRSSRVHRRAGRPRSQ